MTPALTWLLAGLVLALVQVMVAAGFKRRQDGYRWAAGARDDVPQYTGVAARLMRAQANLFETLWVFSIAVLVSHVAQRETMLTPWGAALYVLARIAYVPLYAFGVKWWRSVAFCASFIGLGLVLIPLF